MCAPTCSRSGRSFTNCSRAACRWTSGLATALRPPGTRRLCEEEPLRPSTVILRSPAAKELQGGVIARALREELDWVVLKALEKQPDNRYPSVTALSDDLQAYLRNAP